jgi:Fe-S cluster assembly ATP-binding protein
MIGDESMMAVSFPLKIPASTALASVASNKSSSALWRAIRVRNQRERRRPDLGELVVDPAEAESVGMAPGAVGRAVNVAFSGGEKKRNETVQLAVLRPRIAVIDEIDSGLDIDALRDVARRIEQMTQKADAESGDGAREPLGVLAITHYARLLTELRPDRVHVLRDGRVIMSGGPELADQLEQTGYEGLGISEGDEDGDDQVDLTG